MLGRDSRHMSLMRQPRRGAKQATGDIEESLEGLNEAMHDLLLCERIHER